MNRKRDRPSYSRHVPYSYSKRRRQLQPHPSATDDAVVEGASSASTAVEKKPSVVVVIGLPSQCSVLDVKSRFEIYGPISRTRMDPNGLAYITFRSLDGAQSAIDAAQDPSFQLTLQSKPVQVMWASDPVPQWREAVSRKDGAATVSSKLVRAEMPLSRRGRGNKLGSAIVNPRDENNDNVTDNNANHDEKTGGGGGVGAAVGGGVSLPSAVDAAFKGREIVAYDDIL